MRTYGLRCDVNCSILFTELPLLKRPAAARSADFDAVEFWWPFAEPVPADREVGLPSLPAGSATFRDNAGWIGCECKPSDPRTARRASAGGDRCAAEGRGFR